MERQRLEERQIVFIQVFTLSETVGSGYTGSAVGNEWGHVVTSAAGETRPRRVWLRAFWGFSPEDEGYVGFTKSGDRELFFGEYQEGDLILVYGADQEQTQRDQRRQVLGFLEVEPVAVTDAERSSDPNRGWKVENGWQDRWTYGVPVKLGG